MQNIAVIGSGTMGNGIAQVFAQHGYSVSLVDISEEALQHAKETISHNLTRMIKKEKITEVEKQVALSHLTLCTDLAQGVAQADLVVEAVTEKKQVKLDLFQQIDTLAPPACLLASNTSSISMTEIASATGREAQVIGMHFMNPVPMMKLVEVIRGYATSSATTSAITELCKKLNKIPVEAHDYPGFVANRILMPMINEAIYTLFERVAGVEEIDTVMKLGMAHPMGPLQLADFIGLDVCLSILQVLHAGFGTSKYAPCPLLVNMVNAGKVGIKAGEGFYQYTQGSKKLVVADGFQS